MWSATWLIPPATHVACYNALRLSTECNARFSIQDLALHPSILVRMLCRYATHLFEQSSLPQTAEEGGAQVVHTNSDGVGPHALAPLGLARHDSKLTAIMDDQPDEDYWWDAMHMQFPFLCPPPRPEVG